MIHFPFAVAQGHVRAVAGRIVCAASLACIFRCGSCPVSIGLPHMGQYVASGFNACPHSEHVRVVSVCISVAILFPFFPSRRNCNGLLLLLYHICPI